MFVTRWEPFSEIRAEMQRLHNDFNRVFDRRGVPRACPRTQREYPALNLWADDDTLYVEAELPGFELGDLEIHVIGGDELSMKGERSQPELNDGKWLRQERGFGKFHRSVELPHDVDIEKVTASLKDGVLTVTLPKRAEARPRRIQVKGG